MKKFLSLVCCLCLVLTFSGSALAAKGLPSITAVDLWNPTVSELSPESVFTEESFESLYRVYSMEDGTFDLKAFAAATGWVENNVEETLYAYDFMRTRDGTTFHILVSGNVIWIVFIDNYDTSAYEPKGENCLVVAEIVTDPKEFDTEYLAWLLYYFGNDLRPDVRKVSEKYLITFNMYLDEPLPLDKDGKIDMSLINLNKLVMTGYTRVS